jgi:amidase
MTGVDSRDPATVESAGKGYADYTPFLQADGLRGARIGVARNFFGFHPRVDEIIEACLELMKSAGAELVDPASVETSGKLGPTEIEVLYYEFKADLNAYLSALGPEAPVHSLEEVIAFNKRNHERTMPLFGQEHMLKAQEKGPLTDEAYRKALETNHRLSRAEGIDAVIAQHRLDAFVAPSGDPAWLVDVVNGDSYGGGGCTSLPAVSGYPHITVPAGMVRGLPVGISFFGPAYSEPVLLRLAYAFEQATRARCAPRFLPTVQ